MSKVRVDHLRQLLLALTKKTGQSPSQKSLLPIAEEIVGIGSDYLYKKIYDPIKKLKKNEKIGLRDYQLNQVARSLGHDDFNHFVSSLEQKKDPQLLSLIGSYYSYVRRNAEKCTVLRSPARIFEGKDGKMIFELKGPSLLFSGDIILRHGCLFTLMEAKGGKAFHHIYKIGTRESPSVLQGTFSGVSTAFDPIGGRVVLIRNDEAYASLHNKSLEIEMLKKSKVLEEKKLAGYFKDYYNNNVAPNRSSTFGAGDL